MTVLPTVRRQIEHAAQRQVNTGPRRGLGALRATGAANSRPARLSRRARLSGGSLVAVLGVAVALCVAVAAVVLLGHRRTTPKAPATRLAHHYPLTASGIGTIRFGASPATVVASLRPLLGPPEGASTGQRPNGLLRSICGFDYEIDWVGLPEQGPPLRYTHSAGLTVYFRHSRFAGYTYGVDGALATPSVRDGVMLGTSKGLGLDESLARAQRLYGPSFVITSQRQGTPPNPKLERVPVWHVRTTTGLLYGSIVSPRPSHKANQRTIGSISAGSIPNTPCRVAQTTQLGIG